MLYSMVKNRKRLSFRVTCLLFVLNGIVLNAEPLRFSMVFTYDANPLSAMLILKTEGGVTKGGMVNEFGVSFVEFTIRNGKAKIVRLNPMLKRPFIKKVLKRDFELLWACLQREEDGTIQSRRGGVYRAFCVRQTDPESKLLSLQLEHQKLPLTINLHQFY